MDALTSLGLILLLALLAGHLVKALRIPEVTGYILAGIALGPSILGWVSAENLAALEVLPSPGSRPSDSSYRSRVSRVGLFEPWHGLPAIRRRLDADGPAGTVHLSHARRRVDSRGMTWDAPTELPTRELRGLIASSHSETSRGRWPYSSLVPSP